MSEQDNRIKISCGYCFSAGEIWLDNSIKTCHRCNGAGFIYYPPEADICKYCLGRAGSSWIEYDYFSEQKIYHYETCKHCAGSGTCQGKKCFVCGRQSKTCEEHPLRLSVCSECNQQVVNHLHENDSNKIKRKDNYSYKHILTSSIKTTYTFPDNTTLVFFGGMNQKQLKLVKDKLRLFKEKR
ncbi:MAG: hypothetical protein QXQ02_03215 [Halobacteria archaeon]